MLEESSTMLAVLKDCFYKEGAIPAVQGQSWRFWLKAAVTLDFELVSHAATVVIWRRAMQRLSKTKIQHKTCNLGSVYIVFHLFFILNGKQLEKMEKMAPFLFFVFPKKLKNKKSPWFRLDRVLNIHSIKSFCSPDLEFHTLLCRPFWLPREFTEGIYSDHNHGCLNPPPSQHRPGTQGTVQEYKWAGNRAPRCSFYYHGGL